MSTVPAEPNPESKITPPVACSVGLNPECDRLVIEVRDQPPLGFTYEEGLKLVKEMVEVLETIRAHRLLSKGPALQ